MPWFLIVLNTLELTACLTGFIVWKKLSNSYWKWFPVYLLIVVLTEAAGEYFLYARNDLTTNNDIYRFFGIPIQFLFFFWLFYKYFQEKKESKWPLVAMAVYLLSLVADLAFVGEMKLFFDSFSYTIGNIWLIILLLMFFIRFSEAGEILKFRNSMMFWVSLGLIAFYIGTFPFFALRTTLYKEYPEIFYPYWYIQFAMNWLMYLVFIFAFIWVRRK